MKTYYFIAGEPSGDDIGGPMISALKRMDGDAKIDGVGGPNMETSGVKSLFPYTDLHVMGLLEIIPHIFKIKRRIHETANDILNKNPDVVVTIDAPGFCKRVVKVLRKRNFKGKIIHCVAPSVWAWRPGRAKKMAKLMDAILCLFPFEPPYFEKHGLTSKFIGHPLADKHFPIKPVSSRGAPNIAVLPGSRESEIKRMLPIFMDALNGIETPMHLRIPTLPHLVEMVGNHCKTTHHTIEIITNSHNRDTAMASVDMALATSGTITLETGLRGIPTIVAYKMNIVTYWILKCLVKTQYMSLINIIAQNPIFTERLQNECSKDILKKDVFDLISSEEMRNLIQNNLKTIKKTIQCPDANLTSSAYAAKFIMEF